jgi:hypothetical protein
VTELVLRLARPAAWPAWLREPLLHFVLLGGLLFTIDHMGVSRADDPRVIVVGPEVDAEARELFQASRGRAPTTEELAALRGAWLDNEVLYREGLALQVDRGDKAIRDRVIFKALSVVETNLKPPAADEKTLRDWFEANRAKYDEPARLDFQEAVLAGEADEAAVRAFVETLQKGNAGETGAGLRVYKGRPAQNVAQGYGDEFARALGQAPAGEWRALRSRDGWRAVRLEALTPPRPGDFDTLRGVLLHDWVDAVMAEQRTNAVRALARKYRVKTEAARP